VGQNEELPLNQNTLEQITLGQLATYLESIAPAHFQEDYDNSGLIVGHPDTPVTGVITSLDMTEEVIDDALARGCNVIVAHHPIIFRGLKRLNGFHYVERVVIKAIKTGVALYAIHTNLDNVFRDGVNTKIGERLGLVNSQILSPKVGVFHHELPVGSGLIGHLPTAMPEMEFLQFLKQKMQASVVKHTALQGKLVEKVAVCGGSGGFLLKHAIKAGAQVFVSADYKYHEFFDADGQIVIADIGHYETEQFTSELLQHLISKKYSTFAVHCTKANTNPVSYC
jgi:dinuclear metal center YbgI/SA1388 family protein